MSKQVINTGVLLMSNPA
uniref:Uncharacterized protein n=1 Tax=Amphimedon queenslandica TaxID=400682 RepID=A0A1X7V6T9_AMPQE